MKRTVAGVFGLMFYCAQAFSEVDWTSVVWHNDIFTGKDGGGYTNGLFASIYDISTEGESKFSKPLLVRPISFFMPTQYDYDYKSHQVGQVMITPKDISQDTPDPRDAPYAGVLTYQTHYVTVNKNYADTLAVMLGIVGPSSRAEEVQKFIHKITGSEDPRGWDSQAEDSFVGMLSRSRVYRTPLFNGHNSKFDLLSIGKLNLGSYETAIGTTFLFRYGKVLNRGFSTAAIETGRMTTPVALYKGWYFYIGGSTEYLERSVYIDINPNNPIDSGVLRENVVSFLAGYSYSWKSYSLTMSFRNGDSLDKRSTTRTTLGALTYAWKL